jgi:glycosyltransferase involved in cell wall biosynthesis
MKIGIDFHSAEQPGSGNCTYVRNLVDALLDLNNDNEYVLYVTDSGYPYYQKFADARGVSIRTLAGKDAPRRLLSLGLKTYQDRTDILHVQYVAPPFFRGKLVVTIHDICYLRYPEYFSFGKRIYLKHLVPRALKKSHQIIAVSDFSRQEIIRAYRVAEEKTHITPEAAPPQFIPGTNLQEQEVLLNRLGIKPKYLLFVGRLDVRKNISALISAFALLKRTKPIPHQLVITGRRDFLPGALQEQISGEDIVPHIVFTGFVPEELLPRLYAQAEVFVYPSFYEGFGLPVLEAMASGCPVIASNTSSLPEIAGEAALLVDPRQPERLAQAIWTVVSDGRLRKRLRQKGLEQARKFTWRRTAETTMSAYKKAVQASA